MTALRYDMIASSPEAIEVMKKIGQPSMVETRQLTKLDRRFAR